MTDLDRNIEQIRRIIESTTKNLQKIDQLLEKVEKKTSKDDISEMEGIEGVFDGFHMIDSNGQTYEVSPNYAAKSRLIYGDNLKLIDHDGKKLFKQIDKIPRKKINAIATKKEGLWYAIADTGTYKISDIAAEFNNLQINEKLVVLIPENNVNVPFAALDKVDRPESRITEPNKSGDLKGSAEKYEVKPKTIKKRVPVKKVSKPSPLTQKKPLVSESKEFVNGIAPSRNVSDSHEIKIPREPEISEPEAVKDSQSTIALEDDDLR